MVVLISDVEREHASFLRYFLKIWADCYPFIAEVKGSSFKIRPKKRLLLLQISS